MKPLDWRRVALFGALAATLAATLDVAGKGDDEAVVVPPVRAARTSTHIAAQPQVPAQDEVLALLPRSLDDGEPATLFLADVPPAPAAPPKADVPKPAAPSAPALPFQFLGRIGDGAGTAVLLDFQGQEVTARVGDSLAGGYRVEQIRDDGIDFTYLPMNLAQVLTIAPVNR